jgi:hypothetical protein
MSTSNQKDNIAQTHDFVDKQASAINRQLKRRQQQQVIKKKHLQSKDLKLIKKKHLQSKDLKLARMRRLPLTKLTRALI